MKKLFTVFLFLFGSAIALFSQAKEEEFGVKFGGFVNTEIYYDSRENVSSREGLFLLYPKNIEKDINGVDTNAKGNLNILSIKTRLSAKIKAPDALGAKTSGYIEAEFYGSADASINSLRLRHAYMQLDWDNTSLMIGQYWHPMFVVDCYPATVSFNTGAPFQPFIRSPQIRLTQNLTKNLKVIVAAMSQRDFSSYGPLSKSPGEQNSLYLRNAVVPDLNLQLHAKFDNLLLGISGEYKSLMPRQRTTRNDTAYFNTNEKIASSSLLAFVKLSLDPVTIKAEGIYGQNIAEMSMLSGYAVDTRDSVTGYETYTPGKCASGWMDISYGKEFEIGVFGGFTKNLGTVNQKVIPGGFYGRGENIDKIYRISPRVAYSINKLKFAAEFEMTSVDYGTPNRNNYDLVENVHNATNYRLLFGFFYYI